MADLYYIDDDYYDPEGYFVYVAIADATLNNQFSLEAQALKLVRGANLNFGEFSLTVDAGVLKLAQANLDVYFGYLFDDFDITRNGSATVSSAFTFTSSARIVKLASASISSQFQQSTVGRSILGGRANVTAQFGISALPEGIIFGVATLNSLFGISNTARVTHRPTLTLLSLFNIQASYVGERTGDFIVVPQETNQFDVAYETRNIYVTNELRNMLVNKESRAQLVASETRTYTVY